MLINRKFLLEQLLADNVKKSIDFPFYLLKNPRFKSAEYPEKNLFANHFQLNSHQMRLYWFCFTFLTHRFQFVILPARRGKIKIDCFHCLFEWIRALHIVSFYFEHIIDWKVLETKKFLLIIAFHFFFCYWKNWFTLKFSER